MAGAMYHALEEPGTGHANSWYYHHHHRRYVPVPLVRTHFELMRRVMLKHARGWMTALNNAQVFPSGITVSSDQMCRTYWLIIWGLLVWTLTDRGDIIRQPWWAAAGLTIFAHRGLRTTEFSGALARLLPPLSD